MTRSAHVDSFVRDHLPPAEQWPELLFETPELQFPERLNATTCLLDRAVAEGDGDRMAIIGSAVRWTYRELQSQVNRLARLLTEDLGLQPGNRVLLRGCNSPWLAACWLAVWKAGGVAVGTMPLLRAKELKQMLQLAKVSHALCEAPLAQELELARLECPELQHVELYGCTAFEQRIATKADDFDAVDTAAIDPALIAFTSGTTGIPKGCIHFHRDVLAMCEVFPRHCLKPGRDDIFIGTPPLAFTFGLGGLLCFPLHARASTVLLERLAPDTLIAAIERYRASISFTSPTAYRQMTPLVERHDVSSLKKCVSAGEMLPVATRDQWRQATGIEIHDGVGSTEMIHIYIASDPQSYRSGAIGKPLPGYRAMLVDENMQPVPQGSEGWLVLKGPTGCRYLADKRQTGHVREGWNITGDAYHMDADGYYYYHARIDDIIVTAGYNVAGPEVESVLLEHPAVAECAVVGVPDPDRGQILKAFVVLKPGHAGDEAMARALQDFVKNHAAPYKYPRAVAFLCALPRTETGKLQRFRLKAPVCQD
jgi:2-aminobenzoate-CoA ligase